MRFMENNSIRIAALQETMKKSQELKKEYIRNKVRMTSSEKNNLFIDITGRVSCDPFEQVHRSGNSANVIQLEITSSYMRGFTHKGCEFAYMHSLCLYLHFLIVSGARLLQKFRICGFYFIFGYYFLHPNTCKYLNLNYNHLLNIRMIGNKDNRLSVRKSPETNKNIGKFNQKHTFFIFISLYRKDLSQFKRRKKR